MKKLQMIVSILFFPIGIGYCIYGYNTNFPGICFVGIICVCVSISKIVQMVKNKKKE